MIGIDLFSGAGGMSVGARKAGIKTKIAIDIEKNSFETYSFNHPDTVVLQADAQSVFNIRMPFPRDEMIVYGGPPCQGFSTSNQRTRNADNKNNWLYRSFIKLVRNIQPEWVVFENVQGILVTAGGEFSKRVQKDLSKLGYKLSDGLLNAADFGVPQNRFRYFIIGRMSGPPPTLPAPKKNIQKTTVGEALADLPSLKMGASVSRLKYATPAPNRYIQRMRGNLAACENHLVSENAKYVADRYKHIPPGGNWRDIPERLMRNYADRTRCHTGIYKRLDPNEPSVVIGNFRKNMLIHPFEDRGLSVREAARLQSFPDNFVFKGSIGLQQQLSVFKRLRHSDAFGSGEIGSSGLV